MWPGKGEGGGGGEDLPASLPTQLIPNAQWRPEEGLAAFQDVPLGDTFMTEDFFVAPAPPCPALLPSGGTYHGFHFGEPGRLPAAASAVLPPGVPPAPLRRPATASRSAGGGGSSSSRGKDKVAVAREKNRMAQQRFRQKERQRLAEVEGQADLLQAEMAALRLENARLAFSQQLMEKTLVVRNAMLTLSSMMDCEPSQQYGGGTGGPLLQDPAAVQVVSQQLAAAIGELPSMEQMDHFGGQLPASCSSGDSSSMAAAAGRPAAGGPAAAAATAEAARPPAAARLSPAAGQGGASGSSSMQLDASARSTSAGSLQGTAAASAGMPSHPASATAAAAAAAGPECGLLHRAGSASLIAEAVAAAAQNNVEIESRKLKEAGAPSPENPSILCKVQGMDEVDELVQYWQDWRGRLITAYREAEAGGFADAAALHRLDESLKDMVEVFWYVAQLKPRMFNSFVLAALPPAGVDMSGQWKAIAAESAARLSDSEIAHIRIAWQQYLRRMAVAAVAVQPWVQRLQAAGAAAGAESLTQLAATHLQVAQVAARLQHACQEQYLAAMTFLIELGLHANTPVRCYWHVASPKYMADYPAIVSEIVRLHQVRKQQLAVAASGAASQ